MALTQEQIERMDAIVGIAPTQENNLEQKNINLSDDEFKKMDEITGLKPLENIQQTQPIQEIDEIEEEIKRKNPDDYANWKSKEPISAYNAAKNAAREFNGTYDNIDENANLNWFQNFLKNSEWSKNRSASVDSKIVQEKEKNEQREQRINEGGATLGDKISNAFKNAAQSNIQDAQQKAQINKVAQGVNEADKTSRYEVSGVAKGGQPIYREVDLLEQIGFLEGMQKNLSKNIPVIGALADGADNKKQREIKDKILKGEPIRQDELNYLNYATKRKQEEYVRGYSTAGQIGQGTIDSLGISADILLGSGLASALKIGSLATRAANVSGKLAQVVEWGVNSLAGAGAGLLANPQRIYANYQERMIGNEMKVTDSGMMIFQESEEKPATALIKSMMGTYLMYFTELGGGQLLKGIGSGIAKGANAIVNKVDGGRSATVMAKLMEKNPKLKNFLDKTTSELSKRYEQLKGMPIVGKSTGWIKDKAHFDGFLEEMGEEALEDVLNLTFGVNNEERSLENYIDAVFKSPEEWAIIAGTIAITGAGLSATSYFLGEKMSEAGATQEDIEDVLLNTTENQKKELISEQMQNENIDITESAKYQIQNRDYNLELDNKQIEVENTVYNKLLKGNVSKDQARANAKLFSNQYRKLKTEKARETFLQQLNKLDVEFNIPAEQRENGVYQQASQINFEQAKAKYTKTDKVYDNFVQLHTENNLIEKVPEYWQGETVEEALEYLGIKDNKGVKIKSPIEEVSIYKSHMEHLINDNNAHRKKYLNRAIRTIQEPNLITKSGNYHNYIKLFSDGKNTKPHLQIVKVKEDGNFYVTTLKPTKRQGDKTIIEGQVIYDLSSMSGENITDNSIITNSKDDFNPNPNIYYQSIAKDIKNVFNDVILKGDSKKIKDIFNIPSVKIVKDYFGDILNNVNIRKMPDWMKISENQYGGYLFLNNTIYINEEYIESFENSDQHYIRTLFHELGHIKQFKLLIYSVLNQYNQKLSKKDRNLLRRYINAYGISKEDEKSITGGSGEYTEQKLKNNETLASKYATAYNKYSRASLEVDTDNVAFALQSLIGQSNNEYIQDYSSAFLAGEKAAIKGARTKEIAAIKAFEERNTTNQFGFGRISDKLNTRTFYQSANQNNILFQSAYHGTPHKFDEFSLDAIGTGEGAQAHGWGLYFAENKDTSEGYRKTLTGDDFDNEQYYYDNELIEDRIKKAILATIEENGIDKVIQVREKYLDKYAYNQEEYETKKQELEWIKTLDENKVQKKTDKGQLYEVDIPESDVLLDEDKEIREQSEQVQKALTELWEKEFSEKQLLNMTAIPVDVIYNGKEIGEGEFVEFALGLEIAKKYGKEEAIKKLNEQKNNDIDNIIPFDKYIDFISNVDLSKLEIGERTDSRIYNFQNGRDIYRYLEEQFGSDKEASLKLNEYGIKGITYDGRQDGRCYVIFDDKAVKVLNTFYQEAEQNNLIAGYTPLEVMTKSQELYDKLGDIENPVSESDAAKILANAHILQDAIEANANKDNYTSEQLEDLFLNAYYVMNDQEIPAEILEEEVNSQRTYSDYRDIHNRKKEQQEEAYRGYFMEGQDKDLITIMSNQDASTALHELAHWYLNALNEMAKVDEASRKQLDEVDKWLGRSGDYTVAQQEKFARSFEAYLYKGKAPNSYLKETFENFKQWLKSVYAHITEIEGLGADISKEVEEMFDRMFSNDKYYQERKQANELLKKAKKDSRKQKAKNNIARTDRELDEVEKRHKEVSYQILSAATGKSVKYLKTIFETTSENVAHAKKREAIISSLDSVEDSIKISGGMREEWKEFYSDTGVDYETSESGADYELASKALDTILNKSYKNISKDYESEMSDRAEYFENLIKDAEREYKILLNSYKKENRNVALAAIYDWMDSLDSTIKEDFEQKFIYDSRIIERNEHLDKFDKAKRKIIAKALEVENRYGINKDEKYKEVVVEIMKNLNFLQAEDKARLTTNILDINGVDSLMGQIDSIMDIAKTMEDVNYRRMLQREIHKELQGTKNIKKGSRTVGKYDYRTNKLFEELRELDKLTPEKAQERIIDIRHSMTTFDDKDVKALDYGEKLANKFLTYKANGMIYADTDLMKDIYDEIVRIKLAGKTAKNEQDLREKLYETKEVKKLCNILKKKKKANLVERGYFDAAANLESMTNMLWNKQVKEEYASELLYAETQEETFVFEKIKGFQEEVAKIYGLPNIAWDWQINKYLNEKHIYKETRREYDKKTFELTSSMVVDKEMTKMDLILAYIWSMNPTLKNRLINMFGEQQLDSMMEELSIQDVKLAELMLRTAQSTYDMVNKAYIKKYGINLPKVIAYYPSRVERGSELDWFNDYTSRTLNTSMTKSRSNSELVPMEFSNPVTILFNHINGVAKFTYTGEVLDKINLVMGNKAFVKPLIEEKFGKDVYKAFVLKLLDSTYDAQSKGFNKLIKIIDAIQNNWIVSNIAVRPDVALKQLISANNYATEMPVDEWIAGEINCLCHPKETIEYMMKIPYLKARFGNSLANEALKDYNSSSFSLITEKIKQGLTINVRLGDLGAIIFGGKPYIDYLISQGKTEQEAIKEFILETNRSMQSSTASSLSNYQEITRKFGLRAFSAYRNSQQQYLRKCGDAVISYKNGDMELKKAAKIIFHFMFLQPWMFATATSGSILRWILTGDDDDFWEDTIHSLFNFCSDAFAGISEIYQMVLNRAFSFKQIPISSPIIGDFEREIRRLAKEEPTLEDWFAIFAFALGDITTSVPINDVFNMLGGVGDIFTGDPLQGTLRVIGKSKYRAKRITGND